jgi:hypothetical protein
MQVIAAEVKHPIDDVLRVPRLVEPVDALVEGIVLREQPAAPEPGRALGGRSPGA